MGEFFDIDIAMHHMADLPTSIFAFALSEVITHLRTMLMDAFSNSHRRGLGLIAVTLIIDVSENHFQSFLLINYKFG